MAQDRGGLFNTVSVVVRNRDETRREIGLIYRFHPLEWNFPENPNFMRVNGPIGAVTIITHPYSLNLMRPMKLKARAHQIYERYSPYTHVYERCDPKPVIEIQLSAKPQINRYELPEDNSLIQRSTQLYIEVEEQDLRMIATLISDPYFLPV